MNIKNTRTMILTALTALLLAAASSACESASSASGPDGDADTDSDSDECSDGDNQCMGSTYQSCDDGQWVTEEACSGDTPFCDDELGCVVCIPDDTYCVGNEVWTCNGEGTDGTYEETCSDGDTCVDGECTNACLQAINSKSYMGCEFIAVTTTNNLLDSTFDSDFAVIIGNPSNADASVTVSRAGSVVGTATVTSNSTQAIMLPFVPGLRSASDSALVTDGAYEIVSNVPVVAYQYSPLHFSTSSSSGDVFSYTNDASLLLPLHTLTGNYMASTWPTWGHGSWVNMGMGVTGDWSGWSPGFVAVAGTKDGTQVTVRAATYTLGGDITALGPGESATVTINRGDVLQVLSHLPVDSTEVDFCSDMGWQQTTEGTCPPTLVSPCDAYCSVTDADLTGTTVEATEPVAVFAGHNCTFMPYDSWACDHLEEMMFPLETWGTDFVMTAPMHPEGTGVVPTMYRVLAQEDGTTITFTPAVYPETTLQTGQFVEFETQGDFQVSSNNQIYVTQTMMGQDFFESSDSGDPAMGSGVPMFQARSIYTFLTPDTYTYNFVNFIAPEGATVYLDGDVIGGWTPISTSGYAVARIPLNPGSHLAESDGETGFGITSYGYASYTSYLFPGGMNVEEYFVE